MTSRGEPHEARGDLPPVVRAPCHSPVALPTRMPARVDVSPNSCQTGGKGSYRRDGAVRCLRMTAASAEVVQGARRRAGEMASTGIETRDGGVFVVALVAGRSRWSPSACGGTAGGSAPDRAPRRPPPARPRPTLDTGFERRDARRLDRRHRAPGSPAAPPGTGRFGLDVEARGSDAYGRWDAPVDGTGRPYWSFRAWVRVVSWIAGRERRPLHGPQPRDEEQLRPLRRCARPRVPLGPVPRATRPRRPASSSSAAGTSSRPAARSPPTPTPPTSASTASTQPSIASPGQPPRP